jgi:hypothetical protein
MQLRLMFDRERRQVCVGRQIAGRSQGFEEPEQNLGMSCARI